MASDCLFCRICDDKISADIIYRDERVVAFRDLNPQAPQHILIIPTEHIATLDNLQPEHADISSALLLTATRLARELGFAEDGYRTVFNCNGHGGQSVYHIHLHLLGGRQLLWPPG